MEEVWKGVGAALRCWTRLLRTGLAGLDGSPGSIVPTLEPCRDLKVWGAMARFSAGIGFAVSWALVYKGTLMWLRRWRAPASGDEYAKFEKYSQQAACRIVCILHGVLICGLATVSNLVVGPWAYSSVGEPNTVLQTVTLEISWGYFVFDIMWCLVVGGEAGMMIAHHVASLFATGLGLYLDASGSELVGSLFGAEITNPILQVRWFMLEAQMKGTKALVYVEFVFALTFLICRVFWAPSLLYVVVRSSIPHISVKTGGVLLQLISWVWSAEVLMRLVKAVKALRVPGPKKEN